jgi:hypothetical protein
MKSKEMNHIKLFEQFDTKEGYSVISVFMETQIAVGVFPTDEARMIYSRLMREETDYSGIEIIDIPDNHDLVIVPMGGKGISTSNIAEMENYGDTVGDIVEIGKNYEYDNSHHMVFKADRGLDGFIVLDSSGGTRILSTEDIEDFN